MSVNNDCLAQIFSFLPIEAVFGLQQVSKTWLSVTNLDIKSRAFKALGDSSPETVQKFIALCKCVKALPGVEKLSIEAGLNSICSVALDINMTGLNPVLIDFMFRKNVYTQFFEKYLQKWKDDLLRQARSENPFLDNTLVVESIAIQMRLADQKASKAFFNGFLK